MNSNAAIAVARQTLMTARLGKELVLRSFHTEKISKAVVRSAPCFPEMSSAHMELIKGAS